MSRWVWMSGFLYSSIFHVRSHYFHMHVSDRAQNEHFVTVCHQEIALAIQLHGFSLFFSTGWCIVILPSKNKIGAYFKYIHCPFCFVGPCYCSHLSWPFPSASMKCWLLSETGPLGKSHSVWGNTLIPFNPAVQNRSQISRPTQCFHVFSIQYLTQTLNILFHSSSKYFFNCITEINLITQKWFDLY